MPDNWIFFASLIDVDLFSQQKQINTKAKFDCLVLAVSCTYDVTTTTATTTTTSTSTTTTTNDNYTTLIIIIIITTTTAKNTTTTRVLQETVVEVYCRARQYTSMTVSCSTCEQPLLQLLLLLLLLL